MKLPVSWVSTWEPPSPQTLGFLIGSLLAVGATVSFDIVAGLSADSMTPEWTFTQRFFFGLAVALLAGGYLCGLAVALYRSLREFGVGILLGLTFIFPLSLLLSVLLLAEWQ